MSWPVLPFYDWKETFETLHMWTQVVGKIRLKQTPLINHWWNAPLYLTSRGLTTSPMPHGSGRSFQINFDFISHSLEISTSENSSSVIYLGRMSVAAFHRAVMETLRLLEVPVSIWPVPVEVADPIRFDQDETHNAYNPLFAYRHWRILTEAHQVFTDFRSRFIGKCSPVHFFWGGFDLAVTRFSGRTAPEHPPSPIVPDSIIREAYSHEVSSAGFWPGGDILGEAAFYSYAYPEPRGYREAQVEPDGAYYHEGLAEFILPYERVRQSPDPRVALMRFLETTYGAAAELGRWDRKNLERESAGSLASAR